MESEQHWNPFLSDESRPGTITTISVEKKQAMGRQAAHSGLLGRSNPWPRLLSCLLDYTMWPSCEQMPWFGPSWPGCTSYLIVCLGPAGDLQCGAL